MIRRFDLDTGLVRQVQPADLSTPFLDEVAEDLEGHLRYRAELRNQLGTAPRNDVERNEQESLRTDLRYHFTRISIGFERHDWMFAAFITRVSGGALYIELRASEHLEHGGHDHGPPLVAAMLEFSADRVLVVRVSHAKLATTDDASAAVLEADVIIDLLSAAWLRIGLPPQS